MKAVALLLVALLVLVGHAGASSPSGRIRSVWDW